ncbi:hypothetical protein F4811DRAFT_510696 [Daldinia bambusicola]|nr:hypothetical protein F4811DRAFT_510696 [Daldinia bambusicola]
MEVATPPKRMTRARAAAKDAANTKSTATAATASTLAKATKAAPATTKRTATTSRPAKRKTRTDDDEEENQQTDAEQTSTMNKPAKTRGRPKKVAGSEPEPETEAPVDNAPTATRATRGRKRVATEATAPKREPAKTTRTTTRTQKTTTKDNNAKATTEPAKKTTRARATANTKAAPGVITTSVSTEPTPGLKSAVSRPASRVTGIVKKTVTFQEPEKENLVPTVTAKSKAKTTETATGMRAKPVRKPATTGRTTRATAKSTTSETREKSPLSPKKDAQNLALSRDTDSDDELATLEKTPLKPLLKSPVKPPATKKIDLQPQTEDAEEIAQEATEPIGSSVFGSPARRPPPSPFKDMMKSPPKKVDAVPFVLSSLEEQQQAASSPSKTSILQSPAKRPSVPIKAFQPSQESNGINRSPVKMSLFQSPAKRPASPFKMQVPPMQSLISNSNKLFGPKTSPTEEKAPIEEVQQPEQQEAMETENEAAPSEQTEENQVELESPAQLAFPGRLSAVLPRHADPALRESPLPIKDTDVKESELVATEPVETQKEPVIEAEAEADESAHDPMDVDELETKEEAAPSPAPTTTPPQSPPKQADKPGFDFRAKDLKDNDVSDSEDELASSGMTPNKSQDNTIFTFTGVPSTPTPSTTRAPRLPSSAVKAASRAIRSVSKGSRFSFAPLSNQLNERKFASPAKAGSNDIGVFSPESKEEGFSLLKENDTPSADSTPTRSFFDEEMRIRAEMENQAAIEAALEADIAARYDEPEFDDIPITDEDIELAAEANEMSLMEDIAEVEEPKENHAHDDSISDASQEYGDENAVPIDPALLSNNAGTRRLEPVTPVRPTAPGSFHTVSKVPLKPADDSTPGILKKLSASVSKLSASRPSFFRNSTVTSSVPIKDGSEMDVDGDDAQELPPVTPSKADIWSSIGTPARTPRRDLNNTLLRGAVVFVDVHTSDGADASTVFVELLSQMGARCVKSWPWNPTNSNEDGSASKIGITHVVYKDGGKRTLEKVRESNGVVQCVGVGWVLDCERENKWLEEGPYYIDTSLVPRGGRNRRKSMEPKALANHNGTLVTPMKNTTGQPRECQTVPNNHVSRRDSTAWMRTPSEQDEDEDADHDWDSEIGMLTPVPKTPAPEAVARFAMDISPDTPSTVQDEDEEDEREQLLMRTCPPKKSVYTDLGESVVKKEKDQGILMRLMAARRKSLQFAPKIASPLSKAWN